MTEPKIMEGKVAEKTSEDFTKGVTQLLRTAGEMCGDDATLAWSMMTAAARYLEVAVVGRALKTIEELQKEQEVKDVPET